jgi:hypothetical protein
LLEIKAKNDLDLTITGAYYTEVFRRQDKSKKLPKLEKFLSYSIKKATKKQDAERMLEVAKSLTVMFGGEIVTNEGV